ncbi:hypothetical protein D7207_01410 [Burkholderia cepacia]|nr:hypothetical protein [Burkholderia cepacia]MBA9942109.1 hypothetical protein [Burkholderia cepacia]MBA9972161.1 hypothetical protein [Burkholderia cepacia]MBA9990733.1 hypothetical protein [Burkholderia cepacia]MBA9998879.1 hypothetical protein [Burkholderia cepacia]
MHAAGAASGQHGAAHRIVSRCGEKHTYRYPDNVRADGACGTPQQVFNACRRPQQRVPTALDSAKAVS